MPFPSSCWWSLLYFVGLGDCSKFGCILAYDLEFVSETAAVVISTDSRAPPTMSLSSSWAASITAPPLNQTTCTNYTTPTLVQFRPHQTRPALPHETFLQDCTQRDNTGTEGQQCWLSIAEYETQNPRCSASTFTEPSPVPTARVLVWTTQRVSTAC